MSKWSSGLAVLTAVLVAGCGSTGVTDEDAGDSGTGGGLGGGAGGGAGGGTGNGSFAGLSCDVANLLAAKCVSCHRTPPTGGATFPLLTRADLIATSPQYTSQSIAQRCSVRLHDAASPMPPLYMPQATSQEIAAFDAWVNAGAPAGSCASSPDAGSPDAGPAPTTCPTNNYWIYGDARSPQMNPGKACRQCHATRAPGRMYALMGTVFSVLHEKDTCNALPAGVTVDILNAQGTAVQGTLVPLSPSGNFYSNMAITLPYTARINANGKSLTMTTPQTEGDCNVCHTEQGLNGAQGRIVWPP